MAKDLKLIKIVFLELITIQIMIDNKMPFS